MPWFACVHILHSAFVTETNIDKNIANYVKLQEKNLSFTQTLIHIYFTTGCSPLRNVFIIFCYGLLRPDKTQHSEVPTDLPSHTPQISHLFIRVCPVVHNYKAMCVCVCVCLLCFLNVQYPSCKYMRVSKKRKFCNFFTHSCVGPNLKAFLSFLPYSESQWGPILF